jgi:hypothetical protein
VLTSLLLALLLHGKFGRDGSVDAKALRRQAARQTARIDDPEWADSTDRPDWAVPLFRHTSKVSRQVLRFFKHGFHRIASQALYERHLRPMLLAYL